MSDTEAITITLKEYKELLIIKGKYEEVDLSDKIGRYIEKEIKKELYLKGYPLANEVTKKKVAQYDKENNLLNMYESISDASRNTGITITSISYAFNNKRKTGGGFIWHFV